MRDTIATYLGFITERQAPVDANGFSNPDETLYAAVAGGTQDAIEIPLGLPRRRVSKGAKVMPADVNDPCVIQVRADGTLTLWPLTEGIPFLECQGQSVIDLLAGASQSAD